MLPVQFRSPLQIATSPGSNDFNRAELLNNADELILTKGITFNHNQHQQMKQERQKTIKQYAVETFGYGLRLSTNKSQKKRDLINLESSIDQGKSIALGNSTLSLKKDNFAKKLPTEQRKRDRDQ